MIFTIRIYRLGFNFKWDLTRGGANNTTNWFKTIIELEERCEDVDQDPLIKKDRIRGIIPSISLDKL